MAWSSLFLAAITSQTPRMRYIARVYEGTAAPGRSWGASLPRMAGYWSILAGPPTVSGSSVTPGGWGASSGQFSVPLVGPESELREAMSRIARGSIIEVMAGPAQWDVADFERIVVGQVNSATLGEGTLIIGCYDLLTSMRSRLTEDDDELELFATAGQTTALTVDFTAGATTLTVTPGTELTVFERETGMPGLVRVDSSVTSSSFYLSYTGTGTNQLTGVSATGEYGTTVGDAAIGDPVIHIPLLVGHPVEIALKVLISTGAGTNGTWDTLPTTWGYGLPSELIDVTDMRAWQARAMVVGSGSYSWEVAVPEGQPNGLEWLRGMLQRAGIWLVMRQGAISIRCAQSPDASGVRLGPTADLGLGSIDQVTSHELWSRSAARQYRRTRVLGATTSTATSGGVPTALPSTKELQVDLQDIVWSNEAEVTGETANRLAPWNARVAEDIGVAGKGMGMARVCEGDLVYVSTGHLRRWGRQEAAGDAYIEDRVGTVIGASPDWASWTTRLQIALLPTSDDPFPT
jgi:hypothetical protein